MTCYPVQMSPHLYWVVDPPGINVRQAHLYWAEPPSGTNVRHLYQLEPPPDTNVPSRGRIETSSSPLGTLPSFVSGAKILGTIPDSLVVHRHARRLRRPCHHQRHPVAIVPSKVGRFIKGSARLEALPLKAETPHIWCHTATSTKALLQPRTTAVPPHVLPGIPVE
jgi:hypothetical protein